MLGACAQLPLLLDLAFFGKEVPSSVHLSPYLVLSVLYPYSLSKLFQNSKLFEMPFNCEKCNYYITKQSAFSYAMI